MSDAFQMDSASPAGAPERNTPVSIGVPDDGPLDVQQDAQQTADSPAPSTQLATSGRGTNGRFTPGNTASLKTGERSAALWAALQPAKHDLVERVKADRGIDADAPQTLCGLIEAYAEAHLFRVSMFNRLIELGGPITNKGAARALYTAYLSALDRETKLAQLIGLERKARKVATVTELLS